ncbi:ABC transporter substrate-binding protein [Agromyces atrinae]|uniref:ABC transporter substrate-binding protein n=1 Tax=Agromyces atrinae TaxID=592376 RepID=A0A4Q2M907_9MICO|nr:ABC transporter substrate-binding protein [Agromyces atrinae]NYD67296.1 peptide/nickel transport system substrate-binding protein [Agromyces atrinae]RXZ86873.1 ABC transporter substrate-binding protein [Agromyces atrinae]
MTRRSRIVLAALAATAAATLALTSCASTEGAPATESTGAVVEGGALTFAVANDPISLNPSGTGSGNDTLYVTRQLVDSLLYQNPETGELDPWLAESYTVNDEATVFTFVLRDDVTFSDGTPLTADDVKGTFDDIIAAGALSQAVSAFVGYSETVAVDEHTVEVRFSSPNAAFPNSTTSVGLGIVGAATRAVPFDQRADGAALVGTGPFTLESYTKDVETVLAKRDDYAWAPAALGNDGAAHLDSVTFQIVPEPGVRTGSLTSGQVDVIGGVQPLDVDTIEASSLDVISRANPGILFGLNFNQARPVVADIRVREAISAAVNAEEVRDTALNDLFAVGTSALASTTPGASDESEYFEFDPERAAELLDEAGWTEGSDGIREKDGERLSLTIAWITNFGPNQTSLELIQQQLKAVGIEIELVGGVVPEFLERQKSGDFDIAWHNGSRADGDILRTSFSTAATNYLKIDDPELEALLQKQLATADPVARAEVLAEAQERIASQYYQIPVHELTSILGAQTTVHGITFGADSRLDSLVAAWKAE